MASPKVRRKAFRLMHVSILGDKEIDLELVETGWKNFLPIFARPRKLAKDLRRIARWLDKQ